MSAAGVPIATHARVLPEPTTGKSSGLWRRDITRDRELARRMTAGEDIVTAWRAIVTGPLGYTHLQGCDITDEKVMRTLNAFLHRVRPREATAYTEAAHAMLRHGSIEAAGCVMDLVRGNFGTGKVRVDEDGEVEIAIDAAAASVRLRAAEAALKAAGVIAPPVPHGTGAQVNVQTNVGFAQILRAAAEAPKP